jgi:hypothetical protein
VSGCIPPLGVCVRVLFLCVCMCVCERERERGREEDIDEEWRPAERVSGCVHGGLRGVALPVTCTGLPRS